MLYTINSSTVKIIRSYKEQTDLGCYLVQAQVIQAGPNGDVVGEFVGQMVDATHPFNRGWISSNEIVADGGREEVLRAIQNAPNGQPDNTETLLKLYFPQQFGFLELAESNTGATPMRSVRRINVA